MNNTQGKNIKKVVPLKNPLSGNIIIPPDKSISHRAAMFAALTNDKVFIENFSSGADCKSTLSVLQQLGVEVVFQSDKNLFISNKNGFIESNNYLEAGNSGTTIRMMSGILAGQNFYSVITGDSSLRKRPMARIINPLKTMGANIWARNNDKLAPISIKGKKLNSIDYNSPIASAQVKSAILLAGLFAEGTTSITEPFKSRDHSERMLQYLDANIVINNCKVSISPCQLAPKTLKIPGDISSAAFFLVAGAIVPGSSFVIKNVGLNQTRTGIIDVLKQMNADIKILNQHIECGEEVGDIQINYSDLKGITIEKEIIPRLIDELPVIAVAATQATGTTIVKGAEDLRHKESDRIKTICTELSKLGADIEETPDGFIVNGQTALDGDCVLECYHDHRIAMSAYIAGLIAKKPIGINEFNWVDISFPEFENIFNQLKN